MDDDIFCWHLRCFESSVRHSGTTVNDLRPKMRRTPIGNTWSWTETGWNSDQQEIALSKNSTSDSSGFSKGRGTKEGLFSTQSNSTVPTLGCDASWQSSNMPIFRHIECARLNDTCSTSCARLDSLGDEGTQRSFGLDCSLESFKFKIELIHDELRRDQWRAMATDTRIRYMNVDELKQLAEEVRWQAGEPFDKPRSDDVLFDLNRFSMQYLSLVDIWVKT